MAFVAHMMTLATILSSGMAGLALGTRQAASASATVSPFLWYVTRTMGVSAYVALSFSVILGMLRSVARKSSERISWIVDELHQFVATVAGVFVAGHLLVLLFDPFLPFAFINLLLPINEPYKPTGVAYGIFGFYAVVVLLVSSWLRRRMRYSWWRGIHYVSFFAFAMVTLHGWFTGSDSGEPWMRAIYAFATASVLFLTLVRFFVGGAPSVSSSSRASSRAG
jgi:methionine sulfoxide reductase heme-binding subunit